MNTLIKILILILIRGVEEFRIQTRRTLKQQKVQILDRQIDFKETVQILICKTIVDK